MGIQGKAKKSSLDWGTPGTVRGEDILPKGEDGECLHTDNEIIKGARLPDAGNQVLTTKQDAGLS